MANLDTPLTRHTWRSFYGVAKDALLSRIRKARSSAHLHAVRHLVAHSYDVRLHGVVGIVGCGPGHHDSLVEITLCSVGVVAPRGEDDGALFAHGLVAVVAMSMASAGNGAVGTRAFVHGRECPLCSVATLESKAVSASPEVETHEREWEGLVALVHLRVIAPPVVPVVCVCVGVGGWVFVGVGRLGGGKGLQM